MSTYQLSILTPQGEIFNHAAVEFLLATGELGEFGVLAKHVAMIASLKKGVMKIRVEGKEQFFAHASGILEVKPNHDVLVLVDDAFPADDRRQGQEKLATLAQ